MKCETESKEREENLLGKGVGVRHNKPNFSVGVSGYLGICDDITISDLKKNGTTGAWVRVAEAIGVEQFIGVVEVLNEYSDVIRLPSVKKLDFLKVKKVIEGLYKEGKSATQIYNDLNGKTALVSKSFVFKVVGGCK